MRKISSAGKAWEKGQRVQSEQRSVGFGKLGLVGRVVGLGSMETGPSEHRILFSPPHLTSGLGGPK